MLHNVMQSHGATHSHEVTLRSDAHPVRSAPLPAGDYVAAWRVLSRDGHTAPGRLTFRVVAAQ